MAALTSLHALIEALRDGAPINKVLLNRSRHDAKMQHRDRVVPPPRRDLSARPG